MYGRKLRSAILASVNTSKQMITPLAHPREGLHDILIHVKANICQNDRFSLKRFLWFKKHFAFQKLRDVRLEAEFFPKWVKMQRHDSQKNGGSRSKTTSP